jgi:nephrocystin-3
VDLRWGVPDEAKAEGKVLPACLAEVERCRPYFIGLLGERYGWVPEAIPEELLAAQPWLIDHREQSVTALEILHGVLRNPKMAEHAHFYFRDPRSAGGRVGFVEEAPARRDSLARLKDAIRKSGFPVSENFTTPQELGEWVLRDLTAVIENLYPESLVPDPVDRAAADHEAYAASRCRVYIRRPEYIERLDIHVADDGLPLVVLGESGGGKSALLANWTLRYRERHPDTPVIVHFIGAAPDSGDWTSVLRRLLGEFQRRLGVDVKIPDKPDALRKVFANALHMVAARGRVVIVLDALNQIEDHESAPDMVWLPPVIPNNVRLIVSTLPGRPLEELRKRSWPEMTLKPLEEAERMELIEAYLKQFAKQLSARHCWRIAAAPQSANGLYLTTLLNELRLFGSHEELDQRIGWYLEAANPFELYGKVIARWEQDYGKLAERGDVVWESLVRIWAARRGLAEIELLESLGTLGSPLPRAAWSPLYLAAGDALVNRSGLLTFAHDFLREAVEKKYLPTGDLRRRAHHTLAVYFSGQPQGPRQLNELPWQWQEASEWQNLADLLAQPGFFDALWVKNEFEAKAYWARIETESPLQMEQVYASVIHQPLQNCGHAWRIGTLLADTGKLDAALKVRAQLVEHYREHGDFAMLGGALICQANVLYSRGSLDAAMALHKEAERLCREVGNKRGLALSLGNQALILHDRGDLAGAMALHKDEERLYRELGNTEGLQRSIGNQARILYFRGDLKGAMAIHREQERLCRELGDLAGLANSLAGQAPILQTRGDLEGAMALYKVQERLWGELGSKHGLSDSLSSQALISRARGDLDGATALLKQSERLCREVGYKQGLQASLGNQAVILRERGDLDGAMSLHKLQESFCRELGDKQALSDSLGDQALILRDRGDVDGAMALLKQSERLCREVGYKQGLQVSLGNQALILHERGDLESAISLHKVEECLCRELGDRHALSASLGNQALILRDRGDLDGAMALLKEQESLCRELLHKSGLSHSLGNQALILKARRDLEGAISLANQSALLSYRGTAESKQAGRRLADEALAIAVRHGYSYLLPQIHRLLELISLRT